MKHITIKYFTERYNFYGTIGTLDGIYMNSISDKICAEFGNNVIK